MRINKYIAKSGYTSRRKADDLIKASKVKVNGILINEPGYEVTDDDILEIDGKRLYIEKTSTRNYINQLATLLVITILIMKKTSIH